MSKFSDATLYLAPSGYKEGILFPQKPLSTNGEITFTRASSAWRTNIEGQVEEVCYNLLQYSEEFDNAIWGKTNATVTTNSTTSPDGNTNADTLARGATTTVESMCRQNMSQANNTAYTLTVYAKQNTSGALLYLRNLAIDSSSITGVVTFALDGTNTITAGPTYTGKTTIQSVGNGWYRCSIQGTTLVTIVNNIIDIGCSTTAGGVTGSASASIFIYGAQLVQGSLPRPYLFTTNRQNFPRVDYSLGTGTFLLEPQRTNIHLASTSMYNMATFGATAPTLTQATTVLDPSAGYNAALVTGGSGSSGTFGIYNIIPTVVTSGQAVVVSCYVKAGTHDKVMLQHANVTVTGGSQAYFDLATGTTPTSGASIQAVGNGWYRCIIQPVTFTANSNITSYNIGCYVTPSTSTNTWSSDFTGKSVYFYGIQVEVGSFATSLIPTTSSAATRIADSFSRGNIFTNNLISSSGGTWFVELKNNLSVTNTTTDRGIFIGDTSAGIGNTLNIRRLNAGRLQVTKVVGGSTSLLYTTTTDTVKIAIKWNGTSVDVFENGVKVASASSFTTTNMEFLATRLGEEPYQNISQMALWRTPLTDAQCTDLTL